MKRSSPLWGSVSVLIGVVIAILALVRGAWLVPLLLLTFTVWGLWVVMFQLQPAWDSIRGYLPIVDAAGPDAKVWVVAPERPGIEPFVQYAKDRNPNVTISVGHSEAIPEQIRRLKQHGLRMQTHCMNATGAVSKWLGTKGCGPDEACLLDDEMYAEVICDSCGIHVNQERLQMLLKVKGADRLILITDSFPSTEQGPEELRYITDLVFDANGLLNGSRLTMDAACRNMVMHTGCSITEAFWMSSRNPARMIGMDKEIGTIEPGKKANLVFMDDAFHVKKVMLDGTFQQVSE